jgi:voltage-gated potassium channel
MPPSSRIEQRITYALANLTLRKAVALIVGAATVLAVGAAILVWLVDPAIGTFGDSLWWAVSTVSTVGYGDVVPENTPGRIIGTVLMLAGLSLIPLITSTVVSILVAQRSRADREQELADLTMVLERMDRIDRRLDELESA